MQRLPVVLIALTMLSLSGCTAFDAVSPIPPGAGNDDATTLTFRSTIDGDTIRTSEGVIRIIGIDTPERDECGYAEASQALDDLLTDGDALTVELPPGQNNTDRYDRLLRYVYTEDGIDLGLLQLDAGNAVARYDSTDGHPGHPKERMYRAAQIATLDASGDVVTPQCAG